MNPFKLLGAIKDMGKIQEEMKKAAKKLRENIYEGAAGGGLVTVKATGDMQLTEVKIDPSLIEDKDVDLIQELHCGSGERGDGQSPRRRRRDDAERRYRNASTSPASTG